MDSYAEILTAMQTPLIQTIYMVTLSTIFSLIIGLPLGIILTVTSKGHILENRIINTIIGTIVNVFRSVPFIILLIALFPLSKLLIGTSIGTNAATVALSIAAAPFVARVIENSLKEVSYGLIEASLAAGATSYQIIFKVMLPEAISSLILGITLTIINILGYSAMAGAVGGEGIGDFAIREGYLRYNNKVLLLTIIVLIILVEVIQQFGNLLARKFDKR
ncbi:methionine ABC transporter permease [Clostridium cylindrosporum]|uniref:Putative D-methionine transport system permease protein MetI n=1 Tax=Clostridium cylindrosporum DSM 605 TaxID=1121307 RepID=A0A0J8DA31_CLOCY|nr:methionine ABC transporter permease [Clostridium cylindrosporum]KMT21174.1 putative D-methionine transport system permease protein MetI [Clostridium cylindrosporum DSM 605]